MLGAEKHFARGKGRLDQAALRAALEAKIEADSVREECYNEDVAESGSPPKDLRDWARPPADRQLPLSVLC